ncbi:hypothetical protein LSUB1_G008066 [Lachnellula subtilissima]|uniref:Uncharacterized protein n=1 Tax=Lachnellula subtilissima TaxID=602034 RepID=A0A8H8RDU2_9HELO|nr:hypothetical protein LSUB1_G008066 [Lachnellula subtilissima]
MEPIPLRTLTLLLNYERAVSDPRFVGMRLLESTEADPSLPRRLVKSDGIHEHFKGGPDTIEELHCNIFERHDEISTSSSPSPTCLVHPNASQEVQNLTLAKRELIFYQTRAHDQWFKAIGLYRVFFRIVSPGSETQRPNDYVIKFSINGPFLHVVTSTPKATGGAGDSHIMTTGSKDSEEHGVLAFPCPGRKDKQQFVVDMTRMEYGDVGRGTYGENYFWEHWKVT